MPSRCRWPAPSSHASDDASCRLTALFAVMPHHIALLASPYLGEVTWAATATALSVSGAEVTIASPGSSFDPQQITDQYLRSCRHRTDGTLVAHSNAAMYLPALLDREQSLAGIIVDTTVAPEGQNAPIAPPEGRRQLASIERDGWLPAWPYWWPAHVWRSMVRSHERRAELERVAPPVPLAYLEQALRLPDGWRSAGPRGYLCFQDDHRSALATASSLGWQTRMLPGSHLHMVNEPAETARAILELVDALHD